MKSFYVRVSAVFMCAIIMLGCGVQSPPQVGGQQRARELVDAGTLALRSGDLDRAEAAFAVVAELTGSAVAYDGLGCVEFLRGDFERAEELFVLALQVDPNYSEGAANLALLYETTGQRELARTLYRRAIDLDPQNFRARNNYAGLLYDASIQDATRPDRNRSAPQMKGHAEDNQTVAMADRVRAARELLRAEALAQHPLVSNNIVTVGAP